MEKGRKNEICTCSIWCKSTSFSNGRLGNVNIIINKTNFRNNEWNQKKMTGVVAENLEIYDF